MFRLPVFIILFAAVLAGFLSQARAKSYTPILRWNGEYLSPSEGALFIRLKLSQFKKSNRGRFIVGNVIIELRNEQNKKLYQLSQGAQTGGSPSYIWKLRPGTYRLERLSLIDNVGRNRVWKGPSKQLFQVQALHLANFGLWSIIPTGKNGLNVTVSSAESNYKSSYSHESFVAVIDALSGKQQQILGGQDIIKKSKENYSGDGEVRASFSQVRQISMRYKLDLGRQNSYAKKLMATIASRDVDLRQCYMDELELNDELQGDVNFKFLISKNNGVMEKIKYAGGKLKNKKVVRCLYYLLGQMQFPVAQKLTGKISFLFSAT